MITCRFLFLKKDIIISSQGYGKMFLCYNNKLSINIYMITCRFFFLKKDIIINSQGYGKMFRKFSIRDAHIKPLNIPVARPLSRIFISVSLGVLSSAYSSTILSSSVRVKKVHEMYGMPGNNNYPWVNGRF